MMQTLTIAGKELRSLFRSPIAIIFLGVFLAATLFSFFSLSTFFTRNLADVRPLFAWLPVLLIFLVSAITMRMWAEERKAGTLEVLLTLPVRTSDLVLGKFLAGMALVSLALVLTAPIPVIVSRLGPLDWGPVIGGYAAALMLASAYLAIGLCVSARTDNQVVALLVTLIIGIALYMVGSEQLLAQLPTAQGEFLRLIGSGSRFESVERGVVDARDLIYYGSLTGFFLVLNGYFLASQRIDMDSPSGRSRANALRLMVLLAGANGLAANLWATPMNGLRIDLTENRDYTITPVTEEVLSLLDEPMMIRGFFSKRSHPQLAPLEPTIRDLLAEYEIASNGKVQVMFFDPHDDEELEIELGQQYGIRPTPVGVSDRHSKQLVDAYFHILVEYRGAFEVIGFNALVEMREGPDGTAEVRLRNPEYDITRTIKRVSQYTQSLDTLFAKMDSTGTVTAVVSKGTLPEEFEQAAELIESVPREIASKSLGKLQFVAADPLTDPSLAAKLKDEFRIEPMAVDLFGGDRYYLHLLIEIDDQFEVLRPRGDLTEQALRTAIEAAIKRATPGQLKQVGLFTEVPPPPPRDPNLPIPPAPSPDYRALKQTLGDFFVVTDLTLEEGYVPEEIDVLIVGREGDLTPTQQFALDQYLMGGGNIIAFAGSHKIKVVNGQAETREQGDTLRPLLETYGVEIDAGLVLDTQVAQFPLNVARKVGSMTTSSMQLVNYPFFPQIRSSGMNTNHPAMAGITTFTAPWASAIRGTRTDDDTVETTVLARTTPNSWVQAGGTIVTDHGKYPDVGRPVPDHTEALAVALELTGTFPSYFADKPNPTWEDGTNTEESQGRTLTSSVVPGRLIVFGSTEMVGDAMVQMARQPGIGDPHRGNLQLMQNLIDWSVQDTTLLSIRTGGAFARTLVPMTDEEKAGIESRTWLLTLMLLGIVVIIPRLRRPRALSEAA